MSVWFYVVLYVCIVLVCNHGCVYGCMYSFDVLHVSMVVCMYM